MTGKCYGTAVGVHPRVGDEVCKSPVVILPSTVVSNDVHPQNLVFEVGDKEPEENSDTDDEVCKPPVAILPTNDVGKVCSVGQAPDVHPQNAVGDTFAVVTAQPNLNLT